MKSPRAVLAALAAACLATVTACGSGGSSDPSTPTTAAQELTVGAVQQWTGFNPWVPDQGTSIGLALGNAIYPSAFNVNSDQTASLNEDLLVSAEIVSEDPETIEYTIQPDAQWADGTPITADDFIYMWKHLNGSNADLLVSAAIGYKQIKSVEADGDPKKVKVVFDSPFADWQSLFALMLPAHYMETLGDDTSAWNTGLVEEAAVSGGPFQVTENRDGEYVQLEANPEWYGDAPTLDKITVRYFGSEQAAVQALGSGEIDFAQDLKATKALIAQSQGLANVTTDVVATSNQQFLNTQFDSPTVGDLAVRQAIATAIVPEQIAETVFGGDVSELLTNHHIYAPSSPYYTDQRPEGFGSGDVDAAKAILEDAGYALGSDGVYAKGDTKLTLDYPVRAGDLFAEQVSVLVQDQLKKIGIETEIRSVPSADWFGMLGSADYDLGMGNYPESAFPVSWYGGLYPCKAGYNFARYCSDEATGLYYQAYGTLDTQAQADLVNQVDQILWDDVANIPMFELPALVSFSSDVQGIDPKLPKEYQLLAARGWSIG